MDREKRNSHVNDYKFHEVGKVHKKFRDYAYELYIKWAKKESNGGTNV